jgi:hypothetical protein
VRRRGGAAGCCGCSCCGAAAAAALLLRRRLGQARAWPRSAGTHTRPRSIPLPCAPDTALLAPCLTTSPRDLHLENFNVSNGGRDLIEDASVTLAYGRRYGLVGRNGTGAQPAPPIKGRLRRRLRNALAPAPCAAGRLAPPES